MKKVLIGCAIVTLLVIVAGIGGTVFIVQQFKKAVPDRAATEAVDRALLARDGPVAEYLPPLDGVPTPQSVEGYRRVLAAMHPAFSADGASMTMFIMSMAEESNPLRKLVGGVRGGVGITRAVTHAAARVDSLLLETGVSEGELAYVHALHRYGLMKFETPELRMPMEDEDERQKAEREVGKMLRGIEETLEDGLRGALERQLKAIQSQEDPRPEYAQAQEWLMEMTDARSLFDALREHGLMPAQAQAFASLDLELREYAPENPGAYFIESITFGIGEDDEDGNVSFSFGD